MGPFNPPSPRQAPALPASYDADQDSPMRRAIVLTVDAPKIGKREADEKNRFRLPPGLQVW